MNNIQEIIKEQLPRLPKNVRDAISSIDLGDKIKKIADKNMLHIDQAGNLETETVLVMLGLEPTADYKENIRRELNVSRDRAQTITADIDKEIFMTIRESLKKISQEPASEVIEQTQNIIHHPPLSDESQEIKKQIEKQQAPKKVGAPPPNLPTGAPTEPSRPNSALQNLGGQTEPKEPNLEARPPSEKKPAHIDPYREPVE